MHPETHDVAENMRLFGCYTLGRAIVDAVFSEHTRRYVHASSVTLAAHAAELIVKARIAQEHPLLIFDTLPKSTTTTDMLSIKELFEHGKTVIYAELPERLWATTGYRMKDANKFKEFGKLRNTIMHFAIPDDKDTAQETLRFAFEVVDPLLHDFWDESIVPYAEMWDEVVASDGHLTEQLNRHQISVTDTTCQVIVKTMSWMQQSSSE